MMMLKSPLSRTVLASALLIAGSGWQGAALAQASQPIAVAIASQPLGEALNQLAGQVGMTLIMRPELVAGRVAPAVQGTLTAQQALDRLLQGTGLVYRLDGNAIVVSAQAGVDAAQSGTLSAITVQASADASAQGLSPAFAGGQVAHGARVGILGSQEAMETPFSIVSYTNQLMQDQQARSVADVLQNDPTVRMARGFGNFQETYFIRGFVAASDDIAYNGLYGLLPRQYTAAEMIERVELLRGAGAFLYGAAPSSGAIGGTINVLPKRAGPQPLNQITLGTASGGALYTAVDFSRRFGENQQTGVRINLARRDGDLALDHEKASLNLATIGVDWRGDRVRLSADIGYQENRLRGIRPNVTPTGVTSVPDAPGGNVNYAQPWTRSNEKDIFGTVRGEFDVTDRITAWAAFGARQGKEYNRLANVVATDAATGNGHFYRFDNRRQDDVRTGEIGLRGAFRTGAVGHQIVASVSHFDHKEKNAFESDRRGTLYGTNLYDPVESPMPGFSARASRGGDMDAPSLVGRTRLTSFTLGDTLSMLDDRLLLTLGVRHQRLRYTSYDNNTGVANPNPYDDSRTSPMAAVVYRIDDQLSVYANYIESLSRGDAAPSTASNAGELLPPYASKQQEIGLKYESDNLGATLALFTTKRPRGIQDAVTNYFSEAGQDRHRGAEVTVYGQIQRGLRVLGGVTFLDAKQRDTGSATTDGKRVIGVPKQQGNLGVEWDVPGLDGLTLNARAIVTGSSYVDAANTLRVPGWVRYDLGARYVVDLPGDKLLTLRAKVENVANRGYWASSGGYSGAGYLVQGGPRTFMVNASLEF